MKKVLFFVFLFFSFNTYATKHNHSDENEVRYIKEKKELNIQFQDYLRSQELWQEYLNNHGDWFVIFNENNQMPHRAFGKPILLNNGLTYSERVLSFLNSNNFSLPLDLKLSSQTSNDKYININFTQYYNSLEVIDSRLYAKITLDNELVVFGLDVFNDIEVNTIPNINKDEALVYAAHNINTSIHSSSVEDNLRILPIPSERKYKYHLVYVVYISTRIPQGPADYICYVDAHSGELLMRTNSVMYEAPPVTNTHVEGGVYTTNPFNPSSVENMVHLKVRDNATGTNYFTDFNGNLVLTPPAGGSGVEYRLEGRYAEVRTDGTVPSFSTNNSIPANFSFDNHATIQERTAYYAVNEIHAYLKSIFPSFTTLDIPMETNVDESGSCNAYFGGGSINFYAEGGGCQATAKLPDVVYHEYGHAINSTRYGNGMQNGALNEGYADIWALSLTQNPVLGHGWDLLDPTIFVRRYDQNRKVYPQDLVGEVHADGEIIAGAFWDIYLNLGSMPQMMNLFKYTYDGAPDQPNGNEGVLYTDVLIEVLYADDNDADITNGTPNDLAIVQAFALHGITLLSNAVITHNPVEFTNGNMDVSIYATVVLTYPWAFADANCYYRLNNSNTWNVVPMSASGITMQAIIPSQPNGTVIGYYISLEDIYGYESGVTPVAANISPIQDANLPYFIMVGFEIMQEEDFDFNIGFWQTGAPDDNATTGMWEIGDPIASYDDPFNQTGIVQPEDQHTPGGSDCAFTQNASSIFDGIGDSDVDDGHTTLFSPYYDLTTYTNPAFSYYRWYTNSPASGANPGADWWQVLITDDGTTWHYVENTKGSDINWRKFAFRVQDYVTLTSMVQLKFIASDSIRLGQNLDGGSLVEAAVDDLYLYESQATQSNIVDGYIDQKRLVKIIDLLGREVENINTINTGATLFYLYDDGTVKKNVSVRE